MRATSTAKVTRKIYDFSHEQQQNLLAIVWLYRGQTERYAALVTDYCAIMLDESAACFDNPDENGEVIRPLPDFAVALDRLTHPAAAIPRHATRRRTGRASAHGISRGGCRIQHRLHRIRQSGGKNNRKARQSPGKKQKILDVEGGQTTNR